MVNGPKKHLATVGNQCTNGLKVNSASEQVLLSCSLVTASSRQLLNTKLDLRTIHSFMYCQAYAE